MPGGLLSVVVLTHKSVRRTNYIGLKAVLLLLMFRYYSVQFIRELGLLLHFIWVISFLSLSK